MVKQFFLMLAFTAGLVNAGFAQTSCGTDELYRKLKSEHPEIAVYEAQLEQNIKAATQSGILNNLSKITSASDTVIYDVPIVVHIVHDYGVENISDDNMIAAVKYWEQVYLGQNYSDSANVITPFRKYIGNPRIRLHLATIDPNGKPTKGIVRHRSYLTNYGDDVAKIDPWPQNQYINIWFVNVFAAQHTGAAAYAYYPSSAVYFPYYDGVISIASYYNTDKTIPHELGHVLNLEHTWGNTNQPGVACGDDGVDDTPPTMGHTPTSAGCGNTAAIFDTYCATGYTKSYSRPGLPDSVVDYPDTANAQNIMDYTYCELMFTKGQAFRMRTALLDATAGRNNLSTPANLAATGALAPTPDLPPVADFSVERGRVSISATAERCYFLCAYDPANTGSPAYTFIFKNQSWNDTITGVQWTLSNGASTPTSISNNTVTTTFSTPGWATVSLVATSNAGKDTLTKKQAVYVADPVATIPSGYTQNFASATDHDNWPAINYYENTFKWEWFTGAGVTDGSCMRYRSFDYRTSPANKSGYPVGDYDDLYTPAFDLSSIKTSGTINLNFYTAASTLRNGGSVPDTMEVWASTTCGAKWSKIYVFNSNVFNVASSNTEFIPTSSQWQAQTIPVPSTSISDKTFFKFRYRPGDKGNNLYFDNFSISPYTTEIKEVAMHSAPFKIYPNPTNGDCNIAFSVVGDGRVKYEIKDVAGKTVYEKEGTYSTGTTVQEHIGKSALPNAGIYFITFTNNGNATTQKIVVY